MSIANQLMEEFAKGDAFAAVTLGLLLERECLTPGAATEDNPRGIRTVLGSVADNRLTEEEIAQAKTLLIEYISKHANPHIAALTALAKTQHAEIAEPIVAATRKHIENPDMVPFVEQALDSLQLFRDQKIVKDLYRDLANHSNPTIAERSQEILGTAG
jgi:hypothetical protein